MLPDGVTIQVIIEGLIRSGLRIALIILLVAAARRLARQVIPRTVKLAMQADRNTVVSGLTPEEVARRIETVSHVLLTTIDVLLVIIAGFMVLAELGLNIAPVLAGAGVAGIAIGLGAQTLVKDVLAGLFILIENQYGKGDVVRVAGVSGLVEDVNLRRTILRDLDGVVHSVPNGEIRIASNFARGWSRVNLDVPVSYTEDIDRVRAVIDRVGEELAADPAWGPMILEAPKVLRVEAFQDSAVVLKVLGTTKPMQQWAIAGELRRRIKKAFDTGGIHAPFSHPIAESIAQRPPVERTGENAS